MRFPTLLAIVVTGLAALATAPAAHAGWMTGQSNLPLFANDTVCRNGMELQYATYFAPPAPANLDPGPIPPRPVRAPGGTPLPAPTPGPVTLYGLSVYLENSLGVPALAPSDYTVPYQPLLLDPAPAVNWPGAVGQLTHSASFTLYFNRILTPGTMVDVGFQRSADAPWRSAFGREVEDCWLRTPSRPLRLPV